MDAEDAAPASAAAPQASDAAEDELVGEPVKMTFPQRVDLYGFPLLREEFRQFTEVAEESRRKNEAAALEVEKLWAKRDAAKKRAAEAAVTAEEKAAAKAAASPPAAKANPLKALERVLAPPKLEVPSYLAHGLSMLSGTNRPLAIVAMDIASGIDIELKELCRRGIPPAMRPQLWFQLSGGAVWADKAGATVYSDLLQLSALEETEGGLGAGLKAQIEKDIARTYPDHAILGTADGHSILRRVLHVFAMFNEIGYCQGLNYIAGFLLAVLDYKEVEVFWIMTALAEDRLYPGTWGQDLTGARVEMETLASLLKQKHPDLAAHLDDLGFNVSMVAADWFLTVFTKNLPQETCARVWDSVLSEGPKVIFRVALVLLQTQKALLLQAKELNQVLHVLHIVQNSQHDRDMLMQEAFERIPNFPLKAISKYRKQSAEEVESHTEVKAAKRSKLLSFAWEKKLIRVSDGDEFADIRL